MKMKIHLTRATLSLLTLLTSLILVLAPAPAARAAGTVTDCTTFGPGPGTLENALVGGGGVTFACSGTIIVPVIPIVNTTILDATGQTITLSGNNTNLVFDVLLVNLSLVNVIVADGTTGGIRATLSNLALSNSTVTGNTNASSGGGISAIGGNVVLENSTVSGNTSASSGGGIFADGGNVTLADSTVSDNASASSGGGIYSTMATVVLSNSTISNNVAIVSGGAIHSDDSVTILANSTVSGNTAIDAAIMNISGTVSLISSTVTNNTNTGAVGSAGAVNTQLGAMLELTNSIIADQFSGPDCRIEAGSTATSHGFNLDSDGTCLLTDSTDIPFGIADLLPLTLNAPGTTETHAIGTSSSDALDAIPVGANNCGTTPDQRGVVRPQGADCDIGAVEVIQVDSDGDSVPDIFDNCPTVFNPDQTDANTDGFGDACVSPTAVIGDGVTLGEGVIIGDGAIVKKDAALGDNTVIGAGSEVQKDTDLGNGVTVGAGVLIAKDVTIGDGVCIGDRTVVGKDTTIGNDTTIGTDGIIEKQVQIGERALIGNGELIGLGAVIADDAEVPPGSIVNCPS